MASSVAFNQELLNSWVNLCDTYGNAQRSGEDAALIESLRVQVAVALVSLIQSSSLPMTEQASLNLLTHLLETSPGNSDPVLENPETDPPVAESTNSEVEEVHTPSVLSSEEE